MCILAVGKMLDAAEAAADRLAADGIATTVWDVRVVTPLDADMLAHAASHPVVITIEDGLRAGGAGEAMRDRISSLDPSVDVRVLGVLTEYIPHGKPDAILAELGLDGEGVAAAARAALAAT